MMSWEDVGMVSRHIPAINCFAMFVFVCNMNTIKPSGMTKWPLPNLLSTKLHLNRHQDDFSKSYWMDHGYSWLPNEYWRKRLKPAGSIVVDVSTTVSPTTSSKSSSPSRKKPIKNKDHNPWKGTHEYACRQDCARNDKQLGKVMTPVP